MGGISGVSPGHPGLDKQPVGLCCAIFFVPALVALWFFIGSLPSVAGRTLLRFRFIGLFPCLSRKCGGFAFNPATGGQAQRKKEFFTEKTERRLFIAKPTRTIPTQTFPQKKQNPR